MDENAGGVKSNHIITPATPTRDVSVNQHRVMAELIERLLNSTSTGLCVVDRDYRIVRLNEAMRILLHRFTSLYYQENDVLINDHVPPKLKERTISLIKQCFSGETVNSQLSYPSGGVVYHYKTRVEPFNVNGETLY